MHAAKCWIINLIKIERFDWSNIPKKWKISQKIAFFHIFWIFWVPGSYLLCIPSFAAMGNGFLVVTTEYIYIHLIA